MARSGASSTPSRRCHPPLIGALLLSPWVRRPECAGSGLTASGAQDRARPGAPKGIPRHRSKEVLDVKIWDKIEATPHGKAAEMSAVSVVSVVAAASLCSCRAAWCGCRSPAPAPRPCCCWDAPAGGACRTLTAVPELDTRMPKPARPKRKISVTLKAERRMPPVATLGCTGTWEVWGGTARTISFKAIRQRMPSFSPRVKKEKTASSGRCRRSTLHHHHAAGRPPRRATATSPFASRPFA